MNKEKAMAIKMTSDIKLINMSYNYTAVATTTITIVCTFKKTKKHCALETTGAPSSHQGFVLLYHIHMVSHRRGGVCVKNSTQERGCLCEKQLNSRVNSSNGRGRKHTFKIHLHLWRVRQNCHAGFICTLSDK